MKAIPVKVKIDASTAKYYLTLEQAFNAAMTKLGYDPTLSLQDFHSIGGMEISEATRYQFRADLHDAWEAVVAKRPYVPRKNAAPKRHDAPHGANKRSR